MVRIISYKTRQKQRFICLKCRAGLNGKIQSTERYYATVKKATVSITFDELTCKGLIGTEFPGSIVKQQCEPYEYVIKETEEVVTLNHRYVYLPEEPNSNSSEIHNSKSNVNDFSANVNFAMAE